MGWFYTANLNLQKSTEKRTNEGCSVRSLLGVAEKCRAEIWLGKEIFLPVMFLPTFGLVAGCASGWCVPQVGLLSATS